MTWRGMSGRWAWTCDWMLIWQSVVGGLKSLLSLKAAYVRNAFWECFCDWGEGGGVLYVCSFSSHSFGYALVFRDWWWWWLRNHYVSYVLYPDWFPWARPMLTEAGQAWLTPGTTVCSTWEHQIFSILGCETFSIYIANKFPNFLNVSNRQRYCKVVQGDGWKSSWYI